jgi:hypothetical protein
MNIRFFVINTIKILTIRQGLGIPSGFSAHSPFANYAVWGTDLGTMWDKGGGELFVAFGDTFGEGLSGGGGGEWRSNVLAKSSDTNL